MVELTTGHTVLIGTANDHQVSGRLLISEQHLILLTVIEILWCNFSQNAVEASREQLWLHVLIKVEGFIILATDESVVK